MEQEYIVDIAHVSKIYKGASGEARVLDDVSLRIRKGAFVGIVGDSGSGSATAATRSALFFRITT